MRCGQVERCSANPGGRKSTPEAAAHSLAVDSRRQRGQTTEAARRGWSSWSRVAADFAPPPVVPAQPRRTDPQVARVANGRSLISPVAAGPRTPPRPSTRANESAQRPDSRCGACHPVRDQRLLPARPRRPGSGPGGQQPLLVARAQQARVPCRRRVSDGVAVGAGSAGSPAARTGVKTTPPRRRRPLRRRRVGRCVTRGARPGSGRRARRLGTPPGPPPSGPAAGPRRTCTRAGQIVNTGKYADEQAVNWPGRVRIGN